MSHMPLPDHVAHVVPCAQVIRESQHALRKSPAGRGIDALVLHAETHGVVTGKQGGSRGRAVMHTVVAREAETALGRQRVQVGCAVAQVGAAISDVVISHVVNHHH